MNMVTKLKAAVNWWPSTVRVNTPLSPRVFVVIPILNTSAKTLLYVSSTSKHTVVISPDTTGVILFPLDQSSWPTLSYIRQKTLYSIPILQKQLPKSTRGWNWIEILLVNYCHPWYPPPVVQPYYPPLTSRALFRGPSWKKHEKLEDILKASRRAIQTISYNTM